jgi:hypothetical protein
VIVTQNGQNVRILSETAFFQATHFQERFTEDFSTTLSFLSSSFAEINICLNMRLLGTLLRIYRQVWKTASVNKTKIPEHFVRGILKDRTCQGQLLPCLLDFLTGYVDCTLREELLVLLSLEESPSTSFVSPVAEEKDVIESRE